MPARTQIQFYDWQINPRDLFQARTFLHFGHCFGVWGFSIGLLHNALYRSTLSHTRSTTAAYSSRLTKSSFDVHLHLFIFSLHFSHWIRVSFFLSINLFSRMVSVVGRSPLTILLTVSLTANCSFLASFSISSSSLCNDPSSCCSWRLSFNLLIISSAWRRFCSVTFAS